MSQIKDPELRNIRLRYWNLLHQPFLDEYKIPDSMLENEFNRIKAAEIKELNEYRQRNKNDYFNTLLSYLVEAKRILMGYKERSKL